MNNGSFPGFYQVMKQFTRFYLSLAIAFSAVAGYVLYSGSFSVSLVTVFAGVLLLACGASALNQYQEKKADALMKRTKNRPLPAGLISPRLGLFISIILSITGVLVLWFGNNWITALLGLFNLIWYNGVYTPLKRVTSYVVLIGALTGAIPPLMGWTGAGGSPYQMEIWLVALFMFLWQVPHFYLLLLKFGEEYKLAGFPAITTQNSARHVQIVTFIWIIGTSFSSLLFPVFHVISNPWLIISLLLLNIGMVIFFTKITFLGHQSFLIRPAFRWLYIFQVFILMLLMAEALK